MTKTSHLSIGIGIGILTGLGKKEIGILAFGTLFPDMVNWLIPRRFRHQDISHWGIAYGILALIFYFYNRSWVAELLPTDTFPLLLFCFFAGCALHWLVDAYTYNGVPLVPGWQLEGPIRTGSMDEYAFLSWTIMIIVLVYQWQHGVSVMDPNFWEAILLKGTQ